jgi:hypothetical protein
MAVENKPQHSALKSAQSVIHQKPEDESGRKRMMVKWPSTKEKMEEIRRRSSVTENQISTLWLDYQEFRSLKAEASKSAKENRNKGYSKLLGLPDNEKMAQLNLDLWASRENHLNMRGLERYVNSEHRQWRDTATRETRQAVLEAQKKVAHEEDDLDDFSDYLAAISCEHSADSKLFAKMIAKADEKAAVKSAGFRRY